MNKRKPKPLYKKILIDIGGFGLIILGVAFGWLPGPGGIPAIVAGLALLSLNYEWAERLLKDFDKKRKEYADKYLMASPHVSLATDIVAIALLISAAYGAFALGELWQRGLCFGLTLVAFTILISNQKRFERLASLIKKRR